MTDAKLHQLILGNQQGIKLAVYLLLDGSRRKEQVRHDSAKDPEDNLAAALHGILGCQQRLILDRDNDNQRSVP